MKRGVGDGLGDGVEGFWRERVGVAVGVAGTPALVFAEEPLMGRAAVLGEAFAGMPVRHWWSFKTLPLKAAVRAWRGLGHGVEVVSENELRVVLGMGVPAGEILVNGPAKHAWLPGAGVEGLRVNFDSLEEVRRLSGQALAQRWRVGIRVSTRSEENFEYPGVRTQFGMMGDEVRRAVRGLRRAGLEPEVLHFHLRTQVPEARWYAEAMEEALGMAGEAGWEPAVLDVGGGFPSARVRTRRGAPWDAGFSLGSLRRVMERVRAGRPWLREYWMENGRWLVSPAGVLVVRVLEVKEGRGVRTLICDGGRTLQALVATWERHEMVPVVRRGGAGVRTVVCGPTCMAFDNLGVQELPSGLRAGDLLMWLDAGAYSMSWETRFSHGAGALVWTSGRGVEVVRARETFESWERGR